MTSGELECLRKLAEVYFDTFITEEMAEELANTREFDKFLDMMASKIGR